jgi:hypothetical protein
MITITGPDITSQTWPNFHQGEDEAEGWRMLAPYLGIMNIDFSLTLAGTSRAETSK